MATVNEVGSLRLGVLQLAATWDRPGDVLERVDAWLGAGPEADLVLLPEAALTGYVSPDLDFDLTRFAEAPGGPTAQALADLARRHATTLVAPVIRARGHARYNAMLAVGPDGREAFVYEKRHPWYPETWATAGTEPHPVVTIAGVRVTIAICFDLQFVADDASEALAAAELLLFPSAWVDEDGTRVRTLTALAQRFDLWVAGANWAPGDVAIHGQGDSCILDPTGRVVAQLGLEEGRIDALVTPSRRPPR